MTFPKTLTFFLAILSLASLSCESKNKKANDLPQDEIPQVNSSKPQYNYEGDPLQVAIIGLTHDHVHWIMGREDFGDIDIVAIVEPNPELVKRYQRQYGFSTDLVFDTLNGMMKVVKPEAVMAFNAVYGHLEVVEYFAPKGIHIMVEKPLAVSLDHAEKMIALAKKHKVHLMTNYETSWYGSNAKAIEIIRAQDKIGALGKIVFNTGHPGPKEIGCSKEFLEWLTDPILNGGGAITDFGCYGANLATWIMAGAPPVSISCVTQQTKPDIYPKVDDDAIIILSYPKTQVVIQASWNWSHSRKDMAVYGKNGYVICENEEDMQLMVNEKEGPKALKADPLPKGVHDPFAYFTKLVKENHPIENYGLSSMENNLRVVQILEAAKHAAKTGQTVIWDEFFKL